MARLPYGRLPKALFFLGITLGAFSVVLFVTSLTYRMTASAMEPTLHCGGPGAGCEAEHGDRVLVSRTVSDLVVGSGLTFADRGTHTLKGVPDRWQVLEALGG